MSTGYRVEERSCKHGTMPRVSITGEEFLSFSFRKTVVTQNHDTIHTLVLHFMFVNDNSRSMNKVYDTFRP